MITINHFQDALILTIATIVTTALYYTLKDAVRERPNRLRDAAKKWARGEERKAA